MRFTQVIMLVSFALIAGPCFGQWSGREEQLAAVEKTFGDPPGLTRLDPVSRVWADKETKRVVVDGYIALRAGQLEMLACPVGTKEHESVIAVFSKAKVIHAGLLAIGAKPGAPVKWEPQFSPPSGSEIQVFAIWKDAEGKKQSIDARKWVQELGTEDKNLSVNFVFAGSGFWQDPDTGKSEYLAESGDLICVSNFTTAMLDIPVESAQANSGLLFVAFTERIPEKFTPIRLVLQVVESKTAAAQPSQLTSNESEEAVKPTAEEKAKAEKEATELQELLGKP